jgi:LacI family transcriptional regulator
LCKRLRKMSKKSTIHDIAKELNVTASTVSRALNDHPRISEDTKRVVKATAARLGYQVNGIASALRSGRTNTIGMIVPTADRSFFSSVVRGIEEVTNKTGYNLMICQSNDSHKAEIEDINALLRAQVDGIVLSVAKETLDVTHLKALRERGIPIVLFDRVVYDIDASTVTVNDYQGAYKATEHLIQQGCRRIAHFTGVQHINIFRERLRGYQDALKTHGQQPDEAYIHVNDLKMDGGREGVAYLWSLPQPPDAIFCASDYSALGAIQYLKEKGLKIPSDVAVVGFANEPFTAFIEPALTTVDQHPIEMGQTVAKLFLEQIEAENGAFEPRHIVLNADLIIRQSSLFKR